MEKEYKQYSYDDCIKDGLLRKISPSMENATRSLDYAKIWFKEANRCIECNALFATVISSYEALFHSSRAILYRDGMREKSHYCIARYLEEKYANKGIVDRDLLKALDYYRNYRNDCQYGSLFNVTKEDAKAMIKDTGSYIQEMEKLLNIS